MGHKRFSPGLELTHEQSRLPRTFQKVTGANTETLSGGYTSPNHNLHEVKCRQRDA